MTGKKDKDNVGKKIKAVRVQIKKAEAEIKELQKSPSPQAKLRIEDLTRKIINLKVGLEEDITQI